jgi:hypothetical protein
VYFIEVKVKNTLSRMLLAHVCNPSTWEAEIGSIVVQGQPGQVVRETAPNPRQSPKITRVKQTGGVTQAVEHRLLEHEDLSSTPSTTKKKPLTLN